MTEPSSAEQGYWISPFEDLTQQEYAAWDETQGAPAVDPTFESGSAEGMLASWYGPGFQGSPTASGEPFDPYGFTAAHPTLPFGTELLVTYAGNTVPVRINDRGPFTGDRDLDLSEGAAQALGLTQAGVDYVSVSYPGSGGSGAAAGTPAVDASSYVPPSAYDPNLPVDPAGEVFIPEGGEEISAPYEEFVTEDQPEARNELLDQAQTFAPNVPPETFQDPYAPAVDPTFESGPAEGMLASWYGPGFQGSPTASGEPFDPYGFTAAHPTLPFGTELLVTYGGNTVPVRVNDRGPFTGDRELDLSEGAAQALGLTQAGVDYVSVSYPGSEGSGAAAGTPAVDTSSYVPPDAYDPNLPVDPAGEIFTPEGEFGDPYDDLDA